ncbi:EamA family transporter [Priestia aryabhattai]|uniref:EamA family transporter n=1 Tax=Priestia aryabhattai TaxID=412384 RepID=UPI0034A453C9
MPTTLSSWIAILGLGVLCSAIGFICQAIAQRYTTPTHTGLIFATEPIFAALFAVLFLHELFTLKDLVGSIILIAGILIAQLDDLLFKKRVHYQETWPK